MSGKNAHLPPRIRHALPPVRVLGGGLILLNGLSVAVSAQMVWKYPAAVIIGYAMAAVALLALLYCIFWVPQLRFEKVAPRSKESRLPVMTGSGNTELVWYYPIVTVILGAGVPLALVSLILIHAGVGTLGPLN